MRAIFLILAVLLAIGVGVAMTPLETALKFTMLDRAGLTHNGVDGNLWSGHIYGAQIGKVALGDISSSMSLSQIAKGRVALALEGGDAVSRVKGGFSYGIGGAGIDDLSIGLPQIAGTGSAAAMTLILDKLTARFPGGECADASGQARAYMPGAAEAYATPGGFSGPALCRDGRLTLDLASASGRECEQLQILSLRKYRVDATVQSPPAAVAARLRSAGFVAGAEGYSYSAEREL
jgi:general secretion pathway protein N